MRENEEDWQRQLETVLIEITGLNQLFSYAGFLILLSKLEGLSECSEMSFETYRKTVFECINLLQGFNKYVK